MNIRTREAVRYLGYGSHAIDERTLELIQECFEELEQIVDVRFIYRIFEITSQNIDELKIEKLKIKSKNLYKNLKDCHAVVIFGATLGTTVDRYMKRYSVTDVTRTVVLQACAAAMLEEYCDNKQKELEKEFGNDLYLRPRFSPGYGDFSILHQKDLLQMLDAAKTIGLTMTDGYMLSPTKSVTAVIGISRIKQQCHVKGCEECSKKDCLYRRSE